MGDLPNIYIDEDDSIIAELSWADSVEKELNNSIDDKQFKKLTIDEITKQVPSDLSDIILLEYQTIIANHLRKQSPPFTKELAWLNESSKVLSERVGLAIFQHNNPSAIARSSYKFCNYNFECEYNYNIKKYGGCFAQHYVHNLVYADTHALQKFISTHNININDHLVDIKKSLNTISFVVNHMYEELKNALTVNHNHIGRSQCKKKKPVVHLRCK